MAYTRVKICGITRAEDAVRAGELGVDAIGLNFVGGPRLISGQQAEEIILVIPPMISIVALRFLNDEIPIDYLRGLQRNGPEALFKLRQIRYHQIYGITKQLMDEARASRPAAFSDKPKPSVFVWLAMPVDGPESIRALGKRLDELYQRPCAIVLDTASTSALGGTGKTFDWHWIAEARAAGELEGLPPIILAGGLTPENVAEAVRIVRPYAVDVSSGVEVAGKPGVKDAIKMRDFIQAARGV